MPDATAFERAEADPKKGSEVLPAMGQKRKAVALLSGGLDSALCIQLMLDQGIEMLAVNFTSPFCTCSPRKEGNCNVAAKVARSLGVPIRVLAKGKDYLRLIEQPRFGYGRGVNPCIDCRIHMLEKTAGIMRETGASFIVTGEVLGQRPMSQHLEALIRIEEESGLKGLILRPLSARLLAPTIPENSKWVDRDRLLNIRGRSRRAQLDLAKRKGIDVFSCAAGGCLLTDPEIAGRMLDLIHFRPGFDISDARLATIGRHFRLHRGLKAILGRNEEENERLIRAAGNCSRMEPETIPGPTMILCGQVRMGDRSTLTRLLRLYTTKTSSAATRIRYTRPGGSEVFLVSGRLPREHADKLRIGNKSIVSRKMERYG